MFFSWILIDIANVGNCQKLCFLIEKYSNYSVFINLKLSIFYNHGDAKLQQIIKSIPAEFHNEWGKHKFRELHLGLLNPKQLV